MQEILNLLTNVERDVAKLKKLIAEKEAPTPPAPPKPAEDKSKEIAVRVMEIFNRECGSRFSTTAKSNISHIMARIKDGHTFDDCVLVIKDRKEKWGNDSKMCEYIRPSTLFAPSHFEEYLNSARRSIIKRGERSFDMDEIDAEILRRMVG
jgi:uncharacterized phage protein (TIGR02220 family)